MDEGREERLDDVLRDDEEVLRVLDGVCVPPYVESPNYFREMSVRGQGLADAKRTPGHGGRCGL